MARTVHLLGGNASTTTYATEEYDSGTATSATKQFVKELGNSDWITFKTLLPLVALAHLTKWYDTEFGVLACPGTGEGDKSLILKKGAKGAEGLGGMVSTKGAPQGSYFLLHTHPAYRSYAHHLQLDKQNSSRWEAVVDLNLTVIAFCGNEVANRKVATGEYVSLEYIDEKWPSFLTINPRKNAAVSPELFWATVEKIDVQ
jgi:hypothetical protein